MPNTAFTIGTRMKRKLKLCKNCSKFEHLEEGRVGCALSKYERMEWTIEVDEDVKPRIRWDGEEIRPIKTMFYDIVKTTNSFTKKDFETLDVEKDCELYAEYCMEKWNEDEKKA